MCLDDQLISTYLDGELEEPWKSQVEEHLSYCQKCKSRLESLENLRSQIKDAALSDAEIQEHQERVLSYLEKNYLNKNRRFAFLKKQIQFSVTQVMGAAAALVIVFVGSWSVFGTHKGNVIDVPQTETVVDVSSITPVKATETTKQSLDSYSIDEVIKYLDSKGYDVTITLKGIQPLD